MKHTSRPKRIKTPTILQTEALECGATCLAIVLAYFKCWVSLDELRSACSVSRDGSRAVNIWRAAQTYGLDIKSFKAEPHALRNFHPPMILHWNFNHFVVLEGWADGKVFVNDPACGHRVLDETELDESFTGVVLVCETGPEFIPRGNKPRFAGALARRLSGVWGAISFVVLCGLILMIPRLITPFFSKIFVEDVLTGNAGNWLVPLLLSMAGVALFLGVLTWLQQTSLNRIEAWFTLKESSRLFWHILHLPVTFFDRHFIGDITSRLTLTSRVAEILSRDVAINFLNVVMVVLFAILMLHYNPTLTGACLAFLLLDVAALYLISRRRFDTNRRLVMEQGRLQGSILSGLEIIETVKALGDESGLMARWTGYQAKIINIEQELERSSAWLQAIPPLLAALNTAIVLAIGSVQVLQGKLSIGELVAFQLLLALFLAPVARLVGIGAKLQVAMGDLNRLDDILRQPMALDPSLVEPATMIGGIKLSGAVELKNVSFGYSRSDPPLIQNLQLRLEPGERIAIVGPSGSGKSTVAKLVAGLLEPWEGEICFDHYPRKCLSHAALAGSVAIVEQRTTLFEGSVLDNLTLWNPAVPLEEVETAARIACIHGDIMARSRCYQDLLEEGGHNWSGGQRQRLDIARALVGRPSILILDEATSALDPLLELKIDEHLRELGCTCLIVAHRLSTIRNADRIVVLDKGKVVECGTHEELLARNGLYYHLATTI